MRLKLKRGNFEKFEESHRDTFDQRRKFASAVFSYYAPNGDEYRRRFNQPIGTPRIQFWDVAPHEITITI